MEVPAPIAGVVKEVKLKVGDKVREGTLIAVLEAAAGEAGKPTPEPAEDEVVAQPRQDPMREEPAPKEAPPAAAAVEPPSAPPPGAPTPPGRRAPPVSPGIGTEGHRRAHASPAVRKFARSLGVDLGQVKGSARKGRITKDDVTAYVKQVMQ